jgi:hypothetical protein
MMNRYALAAAAALLAAAGAAQAQDARNGADAEARDSRQAEPANGVEAQEAEPEAQAAPPPRRSTLPVPARPSREYSRGPRRPR